MGLTRLLEAEEAHHKIHIGLVNDTVYAHAALTLGGFLGEDVTLERLLVRDLSGAGYLEALLGTGVCFNLRHCKMRFEMIPLRRPRSGGTLIGPLQAMPRGFPTGPQR